MSDAYLGEIRMVTFNYAPRGWAFCNGDLLLINQNQALFSLIGTYYGGNGTTNFALPDLRGRVPAHFGSGFYLGQKGGTEAETLALTHLGTHNHQVKASSASANKPSPVGNAWSVGSANPYDQAVDAAMQAATTVSGGGQPHTNMQPYLTLNFIIAVMGIYPSRS